MVKLPSFNISILKIAEIIELLYKKNNSTIDEISKYANLGKSYSIAGVNAAIMLGIVDKQSKDLYSVNKEVEMFINTAFTTNNKINMMSHFVQKWKPFISFISYMKLGYTKEQASQKTIILHDIENKASNTFTNMCILWGNELNIFSIDSSNIIKLEDIIEDKYKNNSITLLEDDIAIRLYIIDKLGELSFNYMHEDEIILLIAAYNKIYTSPSDSVHNTGKAFEDFIRRISKHVNINVKDKNGINQIVNILYNNKDSSGNLDSKILSKQYNISAAIADIRNMSGHNKEAKSERSWNISEYSAYMFFLLVLSTIRSIYLFVFEDKYEF